MNIIKYTLLNVVFLYLQTSSVTFMKFDPAIEISTPPTEGLSGRSEMVEKANLGFTKVMTGDSTAKKLGPEIQSIVLKVTEKEYEPTVKAGDGQINTVSFKTTARVVMTGPNRHKTDSAPVAARGLDIEANDLNC